MRARRDGRRRDLVVLLLSTCVALTLGGGQALAVLASQPVDPGANGLAKGQDNGKGPKATATPTITPTPEPTPDDSPTSSPVPAASPSASGTPAPSGDGGREADTRGSDGDRTHPPGNNGTVKIDGEPWDDHPDNEPHVGCVFELDLYGYDEGDLSADYRFELWAPTGSGTLVAGSTPIGEDPAGGGTDHDASVRIDLEERLLDSGFDPHPIQGWHVRLTVNADGSIGADVKHKMFWVRCGGAAPTASPTVSPTETRPPTPTTSPSVQPSTFRPPTAPPRDLPFTGSSVGALAALAAMLLLAGTAALRLSARPRLVRTRRR